MKEKACGNPKCSTSTGIHEGLTFGSGELDDHGFWEHPCRICAAAHDADRPRLLLEAVTTILQDKIKSGETNPSRIWKETIREVGQNCSWIFTPGWPYAPKIPQNTYKTVEKMQS